MFIHWIFERGKEKGLEESDPEPHRKHSVECSKETRQCMNVCKWKITEKKNDTMILDQAASTSGELLTKAVLADTEKAI